MKAFVIVLMLSVTTIGASNGYYMITGKSLVDLASMIQPSTDVLTSSSAAGQAGVPSKAATSQPKAPAATPTSESTEVAQQFEPFWVQNNRATDLWSGVDDRAVSFGQVPPQSYFQVVAPQQGQRLYVFNPRTQNYAYIDASVVGSSSSPPQGYR